MTGFGHIRLLQGRCVIKRLFLVALLSLFAGFSAHATSVGFTKTGIASYYGTKFQGKLTANGERFDMNQLTAAHKSLPFNSKVRVTNLQNNKSVVVRITDRGPWVKNREIDLSRAAFSQIGRTSRGLLKVRIERIE